VSVYSRRGICMAKFKITYLTEDTEEVEPARG
jgi:hypothetical protein